MKVTNYLLGYENMYIVQDSNMFNFSLDSVLLPNFVSITKKTKKILDICCGNAPIPLILSTRTDASIIGVEIQKEIYDLAVESIKINNKEDQIQVINNDINIQAGLWSSCMFDTITCNPPYFKYTSQSNINDNINKTIARHEIKINLEQIISISKKLLNNNGNLAIVHRPERMIEIIELMKKNNIEPKRMQLVYPSLDKEANILLIEGVKNGKPGLTLLPPIYSHDASGIYTDQIKKYFVNN